MLFAWSRLSFFAYPDFLQNRFTINPCGKQVIIGILPIMHMVIVKYRQQGVCQNSFKLPIDGECRHSHLCMDSHTGHRVWQGAWYTYNFYSCNLYRPTVTIIRTALLGFKLRTSSTGINNRWISETKLNITGFQNFHWTRLQNSNDFLLRRTFLSNKSFVSETPCLRHRWHHCFLVHCHLDNELRSMVLLRLFAGQWRGWLLGIAHYWPGRSMEVGFTGSCHTKREKWCVRSHIVGGSIDGDLLQALPALHRALYT